jgi:hypothetical protein
MPWSASERVGRASAQTLKSVQDSVRLVWQGLVEIGHNSLAVLGLACIGLVLFFSSDSALRLQIERQALEWLNLRHGAAESSAEPNLLADLAEPGAANRAAAKAVSALPKDQAAVATWLAKRYRVAPDAVARLVQEAWGLGKKAGVEPTLILAIMAIESSFNPFAQSPVGAQGLMQVMTSVHDDKYEAFGGKFAAFDPVTNLRVGVQVLAECVARAGGSVELGLKYYVGAANLPDDGGYAERVFFEQNQLKLVAGGQAVPLNVAFARSPTTVAAAGNPGPSPGVPGGSALASKAQLQPGARESLHTGVAASSSHTALTPAAHAAPGTVMAPAVGAALAANLSAPGPAVSSAPGTTSTATAAATGNSAGERATTAGAGLASVQASPPAATPSVQPGAQAQPAAAASPENKAPKDTKAKNDHPVPPSAGNTKVATAADAVR